MTINYLWLFRAAASLFQAAKVKGTDELVDSQELSVARDELMRVVFRRDRSYEDNMDGIMADAKASGDVKAAVRDLAEGIVALVAHEQEPSWPIYRIGHELKRLWESLTDIDKAVCKDFAEQAFSDWSGLHFVKEAKWLCLEPPADPEKRKKAEFHMDVEKRKGSFTFEEAYERWANNRLHVEQPKTKQPSDERDTPILATAPQVDESAFRPAKEFLKERYESYPKLHSALRKNPWIRKRHPTTNRLEIHAGDWQKFLNESAAVPGNPLDLPAEMVDKAVKEVEEQKAKERANKPQK